MDKINRYKLVSRLKGFEQEAKTLRTHIKKAKAKKRSIHSLQNAKSEIGWDARHHLLAYAFLRKIPYHALEGKCRSDNLPNVELILTIAEAFFDWKGKKPNKAKIENWLAGFDTEEIVSESPEIKTETKTGYLDKLKVLLTGTL